MRPSLLAVLLAVSVGAVACTDQPQPLPVAVNPNPPVPPRREEAVPKPPPSEDLLVWRPGDWEWDGNGYVWRPGEYVKLGSHSNQFMMGHWAVINGTWSWEPGHWL